MEGTEHQSTPDTVRRNRMECSFIDTQPEWSRVKETLSRTYVVEVFSPSVNLETGSTLVTCRPSLGPLVPREDTQGVGLLMFHTLTSYSEKLSTSCCETLSQTFL